MRSHCQRTARAVWGAVLAAGLFAAPAPAQGPAAPAVAKQYTKRHEFSLPINMLPQDRGNVSEVRLFVKTPTTDWLHKATVPPTQSSFTFRAPQDGEYWFSVVTIDRDGQAIPKDVTREPPNLIIIVDTQPPQFALQPWMAPTGETCLRCVLQDANPDYQSLKIAYQGPGQVWFALDPFPGQLGAFRLPSVGALSGPVRVAACDLAKNVVQRDVPLKDVLAAVRPIGPGSASPPGVPHVAAVPPTPGVTQAAYQTPVSPPATGVETGAQKPAPVADPTGQHNGALQRLLNTTHASVDYKIDQVGPSGVGKVEIWMTGDAGMSWKRVCEDHDRRSPVEIDLPGEGLFGLRLVVTNGNGFGGRAPARGDQPTSWIEVDQTPPYTQLKEMDPVTNGSTIEIRWAASDKNLGPEPIHLFYRTSKDGPWQPICHHLKNDGRYAWTFPRDQGAQFYIRLEAIDLAGNVSRCETQSPLQLDMTEPQAQVVGVTGVNTPAPR